MVTHGLDVVNVSVGGNNMIDDRYIVTEHENGISITMKVYAEWVAENGKPQVFHKTDTVGFKSPLAEKFDA